MRLATPFGLPSVPTLGRDLVALGVSEHVLRRAVTSGRLLRLRRDVYLDPAAWPEGDADAQHLLLAHAEQVMHPDGAVSHWSAARFWDLPAPRIRKPGDPVWLTLPARASFRSSSRPGVEHTVAPLPRHHKLVSPTGYTVTTRARTAVDLSRGLPLTQALPVLDACLRGDCHDLMPQARRRDLGNRALAEAGARGLREAAASLWGMGSVQKALSIASPLRESPIESLSYAHFVLAGLPLPECQVGIRTPVGVFYPDFFWEGERLIGEADGAGKYADSEASVREKEREQLLRDLDYKVVRWLGKEIYLQPSAVMARVARALGV
ncbi:MAG TPA: type IV toxin-antitoxin system AbiEi family antitoxin domain-containing protein [Propionicimonas sp.]